ncbi:hypothetical protein [Euzebya sp.]|uniref:hypothetical protein n=1 Tax=Euzebya sp. TaxID=1971409 RepID=UPI0035171FE8
MYLSAEDARSDFFLAAALYVIGPALVNLLVEALPTLFANTVMSWVLILIVNGVLIAGMPLFLMRYRGEALSGLLTGGVGALALGFGIAAVFAGAVAVGEVVGGGRVDLLVEVIPARAVVGFLLRWASLAVLAIFLVRRAEYAFRPISELQPTLVRQAGIACVGTGVVATVLLLLTGTSVASLIPAAGLAGMFALASQQLPQAGMGERWWVFAPVITLALGPLEIFSFLFAGQNFLLSAQQAAVVALFGLVVVMALHARRGGLVAVGMAAAIVIADLLTLAGGTAFAI